MKFDKFPYVKRPFTEVLIMDWILPCIAIIGMIVGLGGVVLVFK